MIVQVSRATRRLVGRLERGERLHDALVSIANSHAITAGQVSGVGILEDAQLVTFDMQRKVYSAPRTFRGPLHVLTLNGNVSLAEGVPHASLYVALSRDTDNGIEVIGGQLVAARVYALELAIDCWDDVQLERIADEPSGLSLWARPAGSTAGPTPGAAAPRPNKAFAATMIGAPSSVAPPPDPEVSIPRPPPPPAPRRATIPPPAQAPGSPPRSLAEAARALEAPGRPLPVEVEEPVAEPKPGDMLEHPSFGLVEVESEADPGRLRIRLQTGSRREILLDVFEVVPRPPRGERRVFALRPRRR